MSTLGYNIKLHETDKWAMSDIPPMQFVDVSKTWRPDDSYFQNRLRVYELGLRLHMQVKMPDNIRSRSDDERGQAMMVVEHARRAMLDEVFGEFITPLRMAMNMAYSGDVRACVEQLNRILDCLTNARPYTDDPRPAPVRRDQDVPIARGEPTRFG